MQGNTGPFIQYTHARIQALLRKGESHKTSIDAEESKKITELQPAERQVIFLLNLFPLKIQEAVREYSPAVIANYTFDLAKEYNQFYQSIPVLSETDESKVKFRLAMSRMTGLVLKKSMGMLGIQVPDKM